jgi:exonuclease III
MLDFREVLSHCDVNDLGFSGVPWTFNNKQTRGRNVKVRLDSAVASSSWINWFSSARVNHLMTPRSDHLPILQDMDRQEC